MAGRFSVETIFRAIDRVTAPVSRMQNRVGKFTRSMASGLRTVTNAADRFGAGMRRAGAIATVALTTAAFAFGNILGAGADFEQAITNVGAVSLQTRDQISELEALALQLGRTTKFTATESANAMEIMARAGFDVNDILKATPAVLDAAAASGLEIAEVADHVSNVLKGMGLDTSEAARVADVLALASARTNSTIGSLGESMRNVASTARQLNVPLENVVASVAMLQDVGLDASVAGSAMNVMLTQMAVPSEKLQGLMRRLGVTFKDAKGDMLPLSKVIQQLSIASNKLGGNFDKVAFLAELVGLRGQKAAANLVPLFESGKLEKLVEQLENAQGSAKKMAGIRMDTLRGSLLLLGSAIDGVKVKIFSMNEGPLKDLVDRMTEWVTANEDLIATRIGEFIGTIVENADGIADMAIKIVKFVATLWTLITVLKAVSAVMTIVNAVMWANPIGAIIGAIGLLIAALAALWIWWDEVKALLISSFESILESFKKVFEFGRGVGRWLRGGSDDDEESGAASVPTIEPVGSPGARTQVERSEITIRDDTGRAEVSSGKLPLGLTMQQSGAF